MMKSSEIWYNVSFTYLQAAVAEVPASVGLKGPEERAVRADRDCVGHGAEGDCMEHGAEGDCEERVEERKENKERKSSRLPSLRGN